MAIGTPYLAGSLTSITSSATYTASISNATAAGDAIIVIAAASGTTPVIQVSDSKGNAYAYVQTLAIQNPAYTAYVCSNATALTTSDTVTVMYGLTNTQMKNVVVVGCSGLGGGFIVDPASGVASNISSAPTVTSGTTGQASELLLGILNSGNGGGAPSGVAAGWTPLASVHVSGNEYTSVYYQTLATAGSKTLSATLSSSVAWTSGIVAFRAPSNATGSVIQYTTGGQTPTSLQVVTKLAGATSVRLAYSTSAAMTSPSYVAAQTPDSLGYVRHTVSGLSPGTQYYYQAADTPSGGSESLVGPIGMSKTLLPIGTPQSFRVALVSCVETAVTTTAAIDDWVGWNADLNIFTGDFDYMGPTSTDFATQVGVYESQIAQAGAGSVAGAAAGFTSSYGMMTARAWGFYCRSDHEAGPDNGDSDNTYTAANIAAAKYVFPFGTLGDTTYTPVHGLYQTWVVGRVRFIMVDIRNTDRSPGANTDDASKTMLGAAQLAWLKNQLVQPEPLKVIISDVAWMGPANTSNGPDKWWSYDTERQAIISYLSSNAAQVKNVMFWHGDSHSLAVATAAKNTWGNFPVYCAAPMNNVGGALNSGTFSSLYDNSGGACQQYGRITITDNGSSITVAYSGWDAASSVERVSQTDVFTAPNTASPSAGTFMATIL